MHSLDWDKIRSVIVKLSAVRYFLGEYFPQFDPVTDERIILFLRDPHVFLVHPDNEQSLLETCEQAGVSPVHLSREEFLKTLETFSLLNDHALVSNAT